MDDENGKPKQKRATTRRQRSSAVRSRRMTVQPVVVLGALGSVSASAQQPPVNLATADQSRLHAPRTHD
jgi:hypothetical protein